MKILAFLALCISLLSMCAASTLRKSSSSRRKSTAVKQTVTFSSPIASTLQYIGGDQVVKWIPNYKTILMFVFHKVPVICDANYKSFRLQEANEELQQTLKEMNRETLPLIITKYDIGTLATAEESSIHCTHLASKLAIYHIFSYHLRKIKSLKSKVLPFLDFLASIVNQMVNLDPNTDTSEIYKFLEGSSSKTQINPISLVSFFERIKSASKSDAIISIFLQTATNLLGLQLDSSTDEMNCELARTYLKSLDSMVRRVCLEQKYCDDKNGVISANLKEDISTKFLLVFNTIKSLVGKLGNKLNKNAMTMLANIDLVKLFEPLEKPKNEGYRIEALDAELRKVGQKFQI